VSVGKLRDCSQGSFLQLAKNRLFIKKDGDLMAETKDLASLVRQLSDVFDGILLDDEGNSVDFDHPD
jgi:hypothetical protein